MKRSKFIKTESEDLEGFMNETLLRTFIALLFLPLLVFTLVNNAWNAIGFTIVISFIGILGYIELRKLLFKKQFYHTLLIPITLILIYINLHLQAYKMVVEIIFLIMLLESFLQMLSESNYYECFKNILGSFFILVYLGILWGISIVIRQYMGVNGNESLGVFHYTIILSGTWGCDIGAYFIGRWIGFHKIYLSVSPNKSIEGFVGGIVFSCLCIKLACFFVGIHFFWVMILIPLIAIIGDLIESLIKRMAGEKNSGVLIPGHGGILDAFDALILVTPAYYILVML